MNYVEFYKKYHYQGDSKKLILLNDIVTYFFYGSYIGLLMYSYVTHNNFMRILVVPAISFILVSVFRKVINRDRPFTKYDIQPILKQKKSGCSLPSRHVFSASIIAMCFMSLNIYLGIGMLVIALLTGIIRVIGGVHYVSDVVVGYLLGLIIGLLIL